MDSKNIVRAMVIDIQVGNQIKILGNWLVIVDKEFIIDDIYSITVKRSMTSKFKISCKGSDQFDTKVID